MRLKERSPLTLVQWTADAEMFSINVWSDVHDYWPTPQTDAYPVTLSFDCDTPSELGCHLYLSELSSYELTDTCKNAQVEAILCR